MPSQLQTEKEFYLPISPLTLITILKSCQWSLWFLSCGNNIYQFFSFLVEV